MSAIIRFNKFQNQRGEYKCCIFGLLHNHGLATLAEKLAIDKMLIIPALFSPSCRERMVQGLDSIRDQYFVTIEKGTGTTDRPLGVYDRHLSIFVPTERGKRYAKQREEVISTASRCARSTGGLRRLAANVKMCTSRLLQKPDQTALPGNKKDKPSRSGIFPKPVGRPRGWVLARSIHLPDFFESRRCMKGYSEA